MGDRVWRLSLNLVVSIWVARYLGPTHYGIIAFAYAAVALAEALPMLGLNSILRRDLVARPENENAIMGTAIILRLATGLISYGAIMVFVRSLEVDHHTQLALAMAGLVLIQRSVVTTDCWFQANLLSKYTVLANNIGFSTASAVRAGLILGNASLEWFLIVLALDAPIAAAFSLFFQKRYSKKSATWKWDSTQAVRLLSEGWPLLFAGMIAMIYLRIDQVMVRWLVGETETGIYAVAARLAELTHAIPVILAASLSPAIIKAHQQAEGEFEPRVKHLLHLGSLCSWGVAIPLILLAGPLVNILFGIGFAEAGSMAAWLALALPLVAMGIVRNEYLVCIGETRFQLFAALMGATLNVSLNLWLIPHWGGLGAAWASLAAHVVADVLITWAWAPARRFAKWQLRALIFPSWAQAKHPGRVPEP